VEGSSGLQVQKNEMATDVYLMSFRLPVAYDEVRNGMERDKGCLYMGLWLFA